LALLIIAEIITETDTGPTLALLIITDTDDWAYVDSVDHY